VLARRKVMTPINVQRKLPAKETGLARLFEPFFAWDPFAEMAELPAYEMKTAFMPAFDVKETKDRFLFKADMPGIKEADLEINLTGDRLCIAGKREMEKKEEKETYYAYERTYGSFSRAFTLPTGVDVEHIKAELKDGVLTVMLPKLPEAQPKKIELKSEKVKA
jgi:HSP20 family protein